MSKKCRNCDFEVDEDHKGACPNCNKEKGYNFSRNIEEKIKIVDTVQIDLKKAGFDPNRISEIIKRVQAINAEMETNMRPIIDMMSSDAMKKLQRRLQTISKNVAIQQKRLSKLNLPVASGTIELPGKDMEELEDIKENVDKQEESTGAIGEISELLKDVLKKQKEQLSEQREQHKEQKHMHKKTHDRLSPKQTIGLAFAVGFGASVLGALIYGFIITPY